MTGRTTAHLFCSVNGVVESPNLWQFDAFGPEEGEMLGRAIGGGTDVVIGRKLWQEWSQYWPGADDPFGQFINPVRKHVVTSTLTGDLTWNSRVIEGDPGLRRGQSVIHPTGGATRSCGPCGSTIATSTGSRRSRSTRNGRGLRPSAAKYAISRSSGIGCRKPSQNCLPS